MDYIGKHPEDTSARLVYADWLEEHDQLEESTRQRKYTAAEKWLMEFAGKCGSTCTNYDGVAYSEYGSVEWKEEPITYETVVQAGMDFIESDGGEWFTQMGSEEARDLMHEGDNHEKYWENWQIVTGIKITKKQTEYGPFSCSC